MLNKTLREWGGICGEISITDGDPFTRNKSLVANGELLKEGRSRDGESFSGSSSTEGTGVRDSPILPPPFIFFPTRYTTWSLS